MNSLLFCSSALEDQIMGTCVSKCYSTDPFVHVDSDLLNQKLVASPEPSHLTKISSDACNTCSSASVSSPSPSTSQQSSSSSPSTGCSSSSQAPQGNNNAPMPEKRTAVNYNPQPAERPIHPRPPKQPGSRGNRPTAAKRVRSCSPASVTERASTSATARTSSSLPQLCRTRSLGGGNSAPLSRRSPSVGKARSLDKVDQTSDTCRIGSGSMDNVPVEDFANPVISMDCFIFL